MRILSIGLASVAVVFCVSIVLCMGPWPLYVPTGPLSPEAAPRLASPGRATIAGTMAGAGIGVIWLGLFVRANFQWKRRKRKKKRRRAAQCGR